MLALAGMTGAAVGMPWPGNHDVPEVPDTAEGADLPAAHPAQEISRPSESSKQS